MNMSYIRGIALMIAVSMTSIAVFDIGSTVYAQESPSDWRERWQFADESVEINYDELREWRTRSSAIRNKINDLDDDPVEDLPIPILFGVSLSDITPNFGDPRDGGAREHEGLDMMALRGIPIVSPTEAVVIHIGSGAGSGNYVSTANPGGETFVYMHLNEVADIDEGDELAVGDLIGYVGNTGNASGGAAHLHFEIREDREASDPFPRITKEFTLVKKMKFLEEILDEADDADKLVSLLVDEYSGVFYQARVQDIELPEDIADALPVSATNTSVKAITHDLSLGSEGSEVTALQNMLIAEGHLVIGAPTGYFGTLTQTALQAYQRAHGIEPASGYFGPITRAHIGGSTVTAMTREQLITKIAELTAILKKLQTEQDEL